MTDSPTKVPLVTATLVAGVIVAQQLVLTFYGFIVAFTVFPEGSQSSTSGLYAAQSVAPSLFLTVLQLVAGAVYFGAGVFVSLRFVAPVRGEDLWQKVILRGLIATAIGALAALVFGFIVSLISLIGPNSEFFGYAFSLQFKEGVPGLGVVNVLGSALNPLVNYFPLVVLAAVLQRLWLSRPLKYS